MILTEKEASTKWCPHVRSEGDGCNLVVVEGKDARVGKCIGSGCMLWAWSEWDDARPPNPTKGACGLARWQ